MKTITSVFVKHQTSVKGLYAFSFVSCVVVHYQAFCGGLHSTEEVPIHTQRHLRASRRAFARWTTRYSYLPCFDDGEPCAVDCCFVTRSTG